MIKNTDLDHEVMLEKLSALTAEEFLGLGSEGLSYIKYVGHYDGKDTYTLFAADGSHIATGQDAETLRVIARQNSLISMSIQ